MKERDMQALFGKHIRSVKPLVSGVYELKICKGPSIPFSSIKPHQIEALQKAADDGLYHRLTDQPWIKDRPHTFTLQKPFDCFYLTGVSAWIVIWFYKPRQAKKFIFIPIKVFVDESTTSKRKSLTEARAKEIGVEVAIN